MAFTSHVFEWLPQHNELHLYYQGITDFLDQYLPTVDNTDEKQEPVTHKLIADPLLGYVHLHSWEMALLDTKLFQRLRSVKQLGLAYLVFPSLNYSRFEHTIGVLGRLNQILNKLVENNLRIDPTDNLRGIIDKYEPSIRLAALFHDIGHCIFSHVSERVINKLEGQQNIYPSAERIQEIFTEHFEKENPIPIAEIFSISILGNKRLHQYFSKLQFNDKSHKNPKKKLEEATRFVLGLPIKKEPDSIFLAQLISSGFDADKFDYMSRESLYSGIKLEIDLDRILSKLQVFTLEAAKLPKGLTNIKKHFESTATYRVLGFAKGGQFVFEEFCIARLALHVKIYLHQKVRAAEAQLSKYLEEIAQSSSYKQLHEWLYLTESIIENKQEEVNLFTSNSRIDYSRIHISNIYHRVLFQRAFAFGPTNSLSDIISDNNDEFNNESLKTKSALQLFDAVDETCIDEIIAEYNKICSLLKIETNPNVHKEIILDKPRYLNIQQGHDSIYFDRPTMLPIRWTIPIDRIIIYYQLNRALAYIYTPKDNCPLILLATEKIVFNKTGQSFLQESVVSKELLDSAIELKRQLIDLQYYNGYPQLKIISDYLKSAEASEKIQAICLKLHKFKSHNGHTINISTVTTFINQFPVNLHKVALKFLENLTLYDEDGLIQEIKLTITKLKQQHAKILISPLGGILDSATHLMYRLRDLLNNEEMMLSILNDSSVMGADAIILFDDNINSGKQLLNIFAEWLGEMDSLPEQDRLNEKHVDPLITQESKNKLKSIPIYIVYTVGFENGVTQIKTQLNKYLGLIPELINIEINNKFSDVNRIFSANSSFQHEDKIDLKNEMVNIGKSLLDNGNKSLDECEKRSLGYADAQAMVIFPYNVPTMTITCLWCTGKYNGSDWFPLAERRRRSQGGTLVGEDS